VNVKYRYYIVTFFCAEVMFDDIKLSLSEYIQAAEIYAKVASVFFNMFLCIEGI